MGHGNLHFGYVTRNAVCVKCHAWIPCPTHKDNNDYQYVFKIHCSIWVKGEKFHLLYWLTLSLSEFRYCLEQHKLSVSLEQTRFTEVQRKLPEWKFEKQINRLDFWGKAAVKEGQVCVCAFCQQKVPQTEGKSYLILWWPTRIIQRGIPEVKTT